MLQDITSLVFILLTCVEEVIRADCNGCLENGCRLPGKPNGGDYTVHGCTDGDRSPTCEKIPGTLVKEASVIKFSCSDGFALTGSSISVCLQGTWTPPTDQCTKLCPPLKSDSVDVDCYFFRSPISCSGIIKPGTKVKARCKPAFQIDDYLSSFTETECLSDGTWADPLFSCKPDCGISNAVNKLIYNAPETVIEHPWHVALYKNSGKEYICGGTIIDENTVITAAHCVVEVVGSQKKNLPVDGFRVAVGKIRSSWCVNDPYEQRFKVTKIVTHYLYVGDGNRYDNDIAVLALSGTIRVNPSVMPVCIYWPNNYKNVDANAIGTVVGWGTTESEMISEKLRVARLPYYDFYRCRDEVRAGFTTFITSDKFCAGLRNGTRLGGGDSGGGFTIPTIIHNREMHYLYGIVSIADPHKPDITVFTNVTHHIDWLKNVLKELKGRKSGMITQAFQNEGPVEHDSRGEEYSCNDTLRKDEDGNNQLHTAVKKHDLEAVKAILSSSGNTGINERNNKLDSPLIVAVDTRDCQSTAIVKELLEHGADANAKDHNGCTPLTKAAHHNCTEIVNVLLDHRADVNGACDNGNTVLIFAADRVNYDVVNALLSRRADVNARGQDNDTALHRAAIRGNTKIAEELLRHGASARVSDNGGTTPLNLLTKSKNCNADIVKTLLEKGADVDKKGDSGCPPLPNAANHNCTQVVNVLLDHRADVNGTCYNGNTALIFAAYWGNYDVVKALLSRRADVNARGEDNNTALHWAASRGNTKIADELLRHGASVRVSNNDGGIPLNFFTNSKNCNADIVKTLLEKGADVDKKRDPGCPPLSQAANHNCTQVVNVLLDHRADVNGTCTNGNTALIFAADRGNYDVVKALLSRGVDVNARGEDNDTALHSAAFRGNTKIAEELLRHGASVTLKNVQGRTPYEEAIYYNNTQTAELIKNWLH